MANKPRRTKGNAPTAGTVEASIANHQRMGELQMNSSIQPLTFQSTTFDVVMRDNEPWLRASELAVALGYAYENAITRIFNRNKSEFSDAMSLKVNLTLSGPVRGDFEKDVRIFSLRGAHLIAMLARTEAAKAFRVWVLDVLDREVARLRELTSNMPAPTLSPAQQRELQLAVAHKAGELPKHQQSAAFAKLWGGIKSYFHVGTYKDLNPSRLNEAIEYVEHYQWELLEKSGVTDSQIMVSRDELDRLATHTMFLRSWWNTYGDAIRGMNEKTASCVHDHFVEASCTAQTILRSTGRDPNQLRDFTLGYPWKTDLETRQRYCERAIQR